MKTIGFLLALISILAFFGAASAIGSGWFGFLLLWPLWDFFAALYPATPSYAGISDWTGIALCVFFGLAPACAVYWACKFAPVHTVLRKLSPSSKLICALFTLSAIFSCGDWWVDKGAAEAAPVFFAVLTAFLGPLLIFWVEFATRERNRRMPPSWVSDADEQNSRYVCWRAYRRTMLSIFGFVFEGGWREPEPEDVYGADPLVREDGD